MRTLLALLMICAPLAAARRPTAAQLKAQVKKLTTERDELKSRLEALSDIQDQLAAANQARDQAKADAQAAQQKLDELKATLKANQSGGDALLKDLESARKAAAEAKKNLDKVQAENQELREQVSATPHEGDLVMLTRDIQPARPLNLNRGTPRVKSSGFFASRPKGVVVVQVLISEKGEVLDARLIQGLPGDDPDSRAADEACVQAAKTLVFDPATSKDGSTRFKVWQGVGFYLD
jgi:DNA polymerase III gamma/tau subunit